jgi:L-alanine-DL-glutamate epimerase-like enolase superfamily enzyme
VSKRLPLLAPALVGVDPLHLTVVNGRLDEALNGHPYAESPLDIACCDLATRLAGINVGDLRLQVKVGQDPADDVARVRTVRRAVGPDVVLFADANGGGRPGKPASSSRSSATRLRSRSSSPAGRRPSVRAVRPS